MKSKNLLKRKSFIIGVSMFIVASLNFVNAQCDNPTFTEGADRSYAAGDIISRDGKDYKVKVAGWANASISDGYYAPGSGSVWAQAWDLENDPCTNTGGGNNNGDGNGDGSGNGGGNGNGGGGNSNQVCSGVEDHGHGTWYDNLDVQPNGIVKCSFERDDILNTKYGAMDKGMLQESNDARYCGMCVEAIAPEHNNVPVIIQIVDECPDCWDRNADGSENVGVNTKFGDIDLSITAFKALLQEDYVNLGIGDFNWEEVSCPWANPLKVIMQGSNYSYAKVIVANHVNRVAKVEIGTTGGGAMYEMARGQDNGWIKSGFGGAWNNFIMDVKVTDIYGAEVIVTGISLEINPTNSTTSASSNFPACGLVSSKGLPNSLDYVSAFPNPANSSITFVGLEDVNSMEILNLNGQVVASQNFQSRAAQISLDVSYFAPGIYVAKMTGDSETGIVTFVKK
jgi:hypothetical protein